MKHATTSRLLAGATTAVLAAGGVAATGTAAHAAAQPYFTYTNGWRVDQHERELADVNGDGRDDIVGFGNAGTYVALGRTDRTFSAPERALDSFGVQQGWRVGQHPRELADVNGDGNADIVGFGNAGTYVAYGRTDGAFTQPELELSSFGSDQGWDEDQHLRVLGDLNGDGNADIVGFGNAGTYVAYGRTEGGFTEPELELSSFGSDQGWNEEQYPRVLGDLNGDGNADIVGFGNAGTYVSYGRADNTLSTAELKVRDFGYQQGWRVHQHPRELADVNGDGIDDVVGFGYAGTHVAHGRADGTFTSAGLKVRDFGYQQGWRVEHHPRGLTDANGDNRADIVGFGNAGTHVAYGQAGGGFTGGALWLREFGRDQGWRVEHHPRELADVNGDNRAEVVGFGYSQTFVEML
ncbi:FG-GAP repeat domain-containing protein [Kocuria sp. M4R2S49]|uniref:FG-GAP repeat domain-containing protein n=1 Tax=Kocuria rhizosphaericola TaxID=3376284 RepID=UPI0037AF074E